MKKSFLTILLEDTELKGSDGDCAFYQNYGMLEITYMQTGGQEDDNFRSK